MSKNKPIMTLPVELQEKQFVNKATSEVVNYISMTVEVDGIDIVLYAKDATSKQVLAKSYAKYCLELATRP